MEAHIDNLSNHRFNWGCDLMDDKKIDKKIQVNIHFGNENLQKIINKLVDTKMSLWMIQNHDMLGYNSDNYTTVNHREGVIAD
jgi:hypothetical protein